ncbi:MAG: cycloartenol synthase [Verrucomicrobiales bacterium]|nr:cycloartenol synthase [Verrucomicrobiales bacterium]
MNRIHFLCTLAVGISAMVPAVHAQDASLKNEVRAAMQKGAAFLKTKQLASGAWGDPAVPGTQPALTALAVLSLAADPGRTGSELPPEAKKGIAFLLSVQQADGGIYTEKPLANYSTSLALTTLSLTGGDEKVRQAAIKARRFLVGLQGNFDDKGKAETQNAKADSPYDGGIGYTAKSPYSDLSNTHLALEALYYSKNLFADKPDEAKNEPQLDFEAAIKFVSRCQQLKAGNDQAWVSEDATNKGGFIYRPGESKADPVKLPDGKEALRAYGSMSYAGLLSFIYAGMDQKDPRITAVKQWLEKNYSLSENPGMGLQGLYYYYHTMAKTLAVANLETLDTPDGKKIKWRLELTKELFNRQQADGSWVNENGRWMEKDAVLVTSYAVLTLGHINKGL